jgi:2,4-dienoyl-CoA reductase-like NADH-dependent reductase (Old Yellow Enzyme family)
MAEGLAPNQNPDAALLKAYQEWSEGQWGMLMTGNVMVSETYLGSPADVANASIKSPKVQEIWKTWAETCQSHGTPTIVQLCHPGRQSPPGAGKRGFFDKTIAPSAVKMVFGPSLIERAAVAFLFGTPKAMTAEDIDEVVDEFVRAAKQCFDVGFKGVELHGA